MKDLQNKVQEFVKKHNLTHIPEISALDLVSEMGEVAKEILKSGNYGKITPQKSGEMESELGDALYSLITLANSLNIDLDKALNLVLKKYEKRIKNSNSAGSGK